MLITQIYISRESNHVKYKYDIDDVDVDEAAK